MTGGNGDRLMSDINVTPFVDVMLVLLIIFMVTAPMMMQGVDVSLPEAASEPLTAEEDQLVVSIDQSNQVYIADFRVDPQNLAEKLRHVLKGRTDRAVYLKADKSIAYGMVVFVMSEIKAAGIDRLGMITEAPDGDDHEKSKISKP